MRDWLTIELVLAVLLVTSFTSVGLLALWAATSPRHWFVRVAVVLVILSPLLAIPAYEPFVALVTEVTIITGVAIVYRTKTRRRRQSASASIDRSAGTNAPRFSLSSLLLLTFFIAVAAAVVVKLPRLNVDAWVSTALNGVAGGVAVVAGAWLATAERKRFACIMGLVLSLGAGVTLAMFDWFVLSLTGLFVGWPPDASNATGNFGTGAVPRPVRLWFLIPPLIMFITTWGTRIWLTMDAAPEIPSVRSNRFGRRQAAMAITALSLAAFPVFVLGELLTPDPIPLNSIPTPNAYDDFVAAAKIVSSSQFDFDAATPQQTAAELTRCAEALDLVAESFSKPSIVPVNYSYSAGDLPMDQLMSFRAIARTLNAKAKVAETESRYDDAAEVMLQAIEFGYAIRRGGLLIDSLVGTACAGFGTTQLYGMRENLSGEQLDHSIALLTRLDAMDEPFEDVWQRDRVWTQRAGGWHSHLQQLLTEIADQTYDLMFFNTGDFAAHYCMEQAELRLLIVELALKKFHRDNGRWPESLDELAPSYIAAIPLDPFDSKTGLLRYRKTDDGYILYSVGPNRVDDNGAAPDAGDFRNLPVTGDLRLDVYFAPDDELPVAPQSAVDNDTADLDALLNEEPSDAPEDTSAHP